MAFFNATKEQCDFFNHLLPPVGTVEYLPAIVDVFLWQLGMFQSGWLMNINGYGLCDQNIIES